MSEEEKALPSQNLPKPLEPKKITEESESASAQASASVQESTSTQQIPTSWINWLSKPEAEEIYKKYFKSTDIYKLDDLRRLIRKLVFTHPDLGKRLQEKYDKSLETKPTETTTPSRSERIELIEKSAEERRLLEEKRKELEEINREEEKRREEERIKEGKKAEERKKEFDKIRKELEESVLEGKRRESSKYNFEKIKEMSDPIQWVYHVNINKFRGADEIDTFFYQYECAAKVNGWDDEKKLDYLPSFLEGKPLRYFKTLDRTNSVPSWEIAKKLLSNRYRKTLNSSEIELEKRKLQANETVTDYLSDVLTLCGEVDKNMSEERMINIVIKGLPNELVNMIVPMEPKTLADLETKLGQAEYALQLNEENKKGDFMRQMEELRKEIQALSLGEKKSAVTNEKTSLLDEWKKVITESLKVPKQAQTVNNVNPQGNKKGRSFQNHRGSRGFQNQRGRGFQNQRGARGFYRGNYRGRNNYYQGRGGYNQRGRFQRGYYQGNRGNRGYYAQNFGQYNYYPNQNLQPNFQQNLQPQITYPLTEQNQTQACYRCNQVGHFANTCPVGKN